MKTIMLRGLLVMLMGLFALLTAPSDAAAGANQMQGCYVCASQCTGDLMAICNGACPEVPNRLHPPLCYNTAGNHCEPGTEVEIICAEEPM